MDVERESHAATRQRLHLQIMLPMLETFRVPTLFLLAALTCLRRHHSCVCWPTAFAAHVRTIAEAGHSAHWERPAEWNEIVLGFLRRQLVGA